MKTTLISPSSPPPAPPSTAQHAPPAPLKVVRVLLADDDRAAGYSLWALLNWQPGIRICDTAETPADTTDLAIRLRPDVCLVSAQLGGGAGLRVAYRLTQLPSPPQVLIYASQPQPELDAIAMIAGAAGTLWRYEEADELACTIRRAASGEYQPPSLRRPAVDTVLNHLDDLDRPIAAMLMLGVPADAVAGTLGISAKSLRCRRREILDRLGATLHCGEI